MRNANVAGTLDSTTERVQRDETSGRILKAFNKDGKLSQWRENDVLVTYNKEGETVPVQFSLSASISENFDVAVYRASEAYRDEDGDDVSRAEWIRIVVATACDYDLSQDPVKDRGEGIREWHAKAKKASATVDVLASVLASNPELAAQLAAAGVVLE